MKKIVLAVSGLVLSGCLFALGYLKDINAVAEHADSVIQYFKNKDIDQAFELMEKYWPLPEYQVFEYKMETIEEFDNLKKTFGKVIKVEPLKDEQFKDFLIKKTYIIRYENHLIRVFLIYYKNDAGWRFNQFTWDINVDELFG